MGHIETAADDSASDEDDLPLTVAQRKSLTRNADALVAKMSVKFELLNELLDAEVLTTDHLDHIRSVKDEFCMVKELLEIMQCRSRIQFRNFLECLHRTGQGRIADLLEHDINGQSRRSLVLERLAYYK